MADKPLKILYNSLRANNYDVPSTYDNFERILTAGGSAGEKYAAESRHTLYNSLRANNYDVPSTYEQFYTTLFEPVSNTRSRARGGAQPQQPQQKKPQRQSLLNAPSTQASKPLAYKPLAMKQDDPNDNPIGRAWGEVQGKMNEIAYAGEKGRQGAQKPQQGQGKKKQAQPPVVMKKDNKTGAMRAVSDPLTAAILDKESDGSYVDEYGNEFKYAEDALANQQYINEEKFKAEQEHEEKYSTENFLKRNYDLKKKLETQLAARRKEIDKARKARGVDDLATMNAMRRGVNIEDAYGYGNDEEYKRLSATLRQVNKAIEATENKRDNRGNDFWHNLWGKMSDGYTFLDGRSEGNDAVALMGIEKHLPSINKKLKSGQKLTREEQQAYDLIQATMDADYAQGEYAKTQGKWGRAGQGIAGSLDFMKDVIALSNAPGAVTNGVAKGVVKGAAKAMAKRGIMKTVKGTAAQAVKRGILKATGVMVGTTAGGAVIANTTQLGRLAGMTAQGAAGSVQQDFDDNYVVGGKQSLIQAFAEAERELIRENQSEMFGEFLPGMGKILKGTGRAIGKVAGKTVAGRAIGRAGAKAFNRLGLSRIAGELTKISTSKWYTEMGKIARAGGWHGAPGEAIEEYEGWLFDAMTGHGKEAWEEMKNPQSHVDIVSIP